MRFWTSDTHFGHQNIIKYCNRPFGSVQEMNEAIINNWNSVVDEEDVVYHLGDVALGPWKEWDAIFNQLNGRKILVIGNHDRIFAGEKEKMRERFNPLYAGWFDEIYDNAVVDVGDNPVRFVNMSHFPYDGDSHGEDRYTEYRLKDDGKILIHGHTHLDNVISRSKKGTLQIHVGMDAFDYTPVSEEQIINLIESQE